jgi:hypothetical protein
LEHQIDGVSFGENRYPFRGPPIPGQIVQELIQRAASDGIELARTANAAQAAVLSVQIVKAQAAQAVA